MQYNIKAMWWERDKKQTKTDRENISLHLACIVPLHHAMNILHMFLQSEFSRISHCTVIAWKSLPSVFIHVPT